MSTVERKQIKSPRRTADAGTAPATAPVRRRRWIPIALILAASAALLVAAGPTLVSHTPLRSLAVNWAAQDLGGKISCGEVSCGWFSPLAASDVVVQDTQGRPLVTLPAMQGDKGLLGLLFGGKNRGTFRLQQPRVEIYLRENGSNVEDVIAIWMRTSRSAEQDGVGANIEVSDAALVIHDESSDEQCEINQASLLLKVPGSHQEPIELAFSGALHRGDASGPVTLRFFNQQVATADGKSTNAGQLAIKAEQLPLAICQALVCRFAPGSKADGLLHADIQCEWGVNDSGQLRRVAVGQLSARHLVLAGPWLGGDQLRLNSVEIPCQVAWEGNRLDLKQLSAKCDVGEVSCRATLADANRLTGSQTLSDVVAVVQGGSVEIGGQLDLARLAALLPKTLRMRSDTQLTSGQVKFQAGSRSSGADVSWQGRLETSRLVAMHQGRELSWDNPLEIIVAAHHNDRGPIIDRLQCQSDFMKLEGSGSSGALEMSGSLDLSRLNAELSKFIDLGELRLAGQGATKLKWQRSSAGTFEASARLQVADFQLAAPDKAGWSEEQLVMSATAGGAMKADDSFPRSVDTAQFILSAGEDQLEANLTQAVKNPSLAASWPIQIQFQGDAANWLKRLAPWIGATDGWEIQGRTELSATASVSPLLIDVATSQLVIKPMTVRGHGLSIEEPEGRLEASGRLLPIAGRLEVSQATLSAGNVTADAREAKLDWFKTPGAASGKVSFQGDVAQLARWLHEPGAPPTAEFTGAAKGQIVLQQIDNATTAQLDATVENLLVTPRKGRQWREPTVRLVAAASYDRTTDTATLSQFELDSDVLDVAATGKLEKLTAQRELQLTGKLDYDLDKVSRLLQPVVTVAVQLAGRESRSFSIAGPLVATSATVNKEQPAALLPFRPELLTGKLEFGWQWARFFGFDYGRATFLGELEDGVFRLNPVELPVSQGTIRLAGEAHLAPGAAEWRMASGKLVDHVEITHQMCNQWLMLFAPAFCGATQAQGKFSVAIDDGRIPLASPLTGDVSGRLTLHTVEVSAGPLVQELSTLLSGPSDVRVAQESEVQFRMVQGRIYHRNLELVFPELTIRTHGSVGFDESLALLAEMTVPPKWLGNNPLAATLKNQVIQLPIGGTLREPKIDRQAMEQVAAQFVRNAAASAVQNQGAQMLNQQLDRFFGPAAAGSPK